MDNKVGRSNLRKFRTYNPSSSNPSTSSQPPTGINHPVASNPVVQTVNPVQNRKVRWPSQASTPRPSPLPARANVPTSDSGRSTPSTSSNPPVQLPPSHRRPASALLTTSPLVSTLGSRVRGAQTPTVTPEQSSQHAGISPLLAVIKDQQTAILSQNATFDLSLRDLVAELGKLNDRMKQKEEDTKEREAKDKAKEEKEQGQLKALAILAQGVDDVRKRVIGIENVVGVSKVQEGDKTTMLDRLQNIEMNVEEWLERVKDPDAAAIPLDQRGSIQPPTPSSLSPTAPSVVRHEMAVSPFKLSSTRQAVFRTPEPLSMPQTTKVDVSTQVDTSDEQSIRLAIAPKATESGSLCVSCSNIVKRVVPMLHSVDDVDMSDSTAAPSHSKGKKDDTTPCHEVHQGIDDDPFLMQPDVSPSTSTDIAQATQTVLATSDTPEPTQEPRNETPLTSRSGSPPENPAIGSFSPADWRKSPTSLSSAAEGPSPTIPLTITPSQNTSYIIPPFPEGTVAALRKEALVDPYPHPLESTGLGDGIGLVSMAGVVGANSVEAAQRMPSPESQCEEDNMSDDVNDGPEGTCTPKVCDTQRSESKRSSSPTSQPNTQHVEKSTESTPVPPARIMALVRQKSVSTTTESSLTSLPSNRPTSPSNVEKDSNTPRPPSREPVQPSIPIATSFPTHPASQTSNITEDEDTVMTLVMDALPTSPASPPPARTAFSPFRLAASPLVLVSPEPERTRPTQSPESDNDEDKVGLMRLQEWYRQQAVKLLSKPKESITPARPEEEFLTTTTTTTQNEDVCNPERDNPIQGPASPLFSSPDVSPRGPTGPIGDHSTNQIDDATCNDVSGNDHSDPPPPISPLFTSASVSPDLPKENVVPVHPDPPSYLRKLVEIVSDDDADIVPLERNGTPSTTAGKSLLGSEKGKEKSTPPPSQPPQPPKAKLFSTQIKRQTSKAKTRIKRRKVSQDPPTIEVVSEDEEDQPPLKRVKLRLGKAPTPISGSGRTNSPTTTNKKVAPASSSAKKPKSVTVVSPVKTPRRRARGQQPRIATVVWPKLDKPVFDQFIECDICERWYHVGCVGIHPDDIRLSASEIYRCPPCDSGVSKEDLTPAPTVKPDKQDDACARPKCLCPRRKSQSIKKESTFTVESFVGMVKKAVGGRGIKLVYLVKWQGYSYEDATWEEEAAMGLPNPGFFVERFEDQARDEGIDLTLCNSQASLLKCAVDAGWKPNGLFIRK